MDDFRASDAGPVPERPNPTRASARGEEFGRIRNRYKELAEKLDIDIIL